MDGTNFMIAFLPTQTQTQISKPETNAPGQKQFHDLLEQKRAQQAASQEGPRLDQQEGTCGAGSAPETEAQDGSSPQEQLAMAALAAAQLAMAVPTPEQPEAAVQEPVQPRLPGGGQIHTETQAVPPSQQMGAGLEGEEAPAVGQAKVQAPPSNPVERPVVEEGAAAEARPTGELGQRQDVGRRDKTEPVEIQPQTGEQPLFRNVEAAPIKVGGATQPQSTEQSQTVERQLFQPVEQAALRKESGVRVSLQPESLGSVTVELTRTEDGSLRVLLHADNPRAQSILEKSTAGLQSLLMDSTHGAVQVQVERQQSSQGGQQHPFDQDGRSGQQQGQNGQQDQHSQRQRQSTDFLQQLRLGLIPLDGEAS